MEPKNKYELWIASRPFVQQFSARRFLILMAQFFLSPLITWLFEDSPFSRPLLKKIMRLILLVVIFAFLAGLVVSHYQRATLTEGIAQDMTSWHPSVVTSGFLINPDFPD